MAQDHLHRRAALRNARNHHAQGRAGGVHGEVHGGLGHARQRLHLRDARVHEHHRLAPLELVPDGGEGLVAEVLAVIAAEHDHAIGMVVVVGLPDRLHRGLRIGHGQGGEVAEAPARLLPKLGAEVVHPPGKVDPLLAFPRHDGGRGERDHGHVHVEAVLDGVGRLRRPVGGAPHGLADLGLQRLRPEGRNHVEVGVDAAAHERVLFRGFCYFRRAAIKRLALRRVPLHR